jgi:DNA-directed RNA polymerase III subunit RPC11
MYFCPSCANILLVTERVDDNALQCQTCPYIYKIHAPLTQRKHYARKQLDDVLGGQDQWEVVSANIECRSD